MPTRLNPYLHFFHDSREAMEFYRSVLGGRLDIVAFADLGGGGGRHPTTASCTPSSAPRTASS